MRNPNLVVHAGPQAGEDWLCGERPARWWTGTTPGDAEHDAQGRLLADTHGPRSSAALKHWFDSGWLLGESLFACVQGETAFFQRPWHGLRHPLIFYYGHSAVFYVNKLRLAGAIDAGIDSHFEALFEMGVDEMARDDLSQCRSDWPSVEAVIDYRREVHGLVSRQIAAMPDSELHQFKALDTSRARALLMGCEHERIHLETSAVLIRELPLERVAAHAAMPALCDPDISSAEAPSEQWRSLAGDIGIGRGEVRGEFGWDCEYGQRHTRVEPFSCAASVVSNGQFQEFILAGGYGDDSLWSQTGWAWRCESEAQRPAFWAHNEGQVFLRSLTSFIELPPDWPAEVNFHEAVAYAAWRSREDGRNYSLPSEAQYACLPRLDERVWEWSSDSFSLLDGFRPDPLYPEFSAPAARGTHQLLLGGSHLSTGSYAQRSFRNYFRPHFQQVTGFRLAFSEV